MALKDFFNRPSNNQPRQTGSQLRSRLEGGYLIQRENGTYLDIAPIQDEKGKQKYVDVYSKALQRSRRLYMYRVVNETLGRDEAGLLTHNVYMLMDINALKDPTESYIVANLLLRSDRLKKVFNQYHGHPGEEELRPDGSYGCRIDPSMVDAVKEIENGRQRDNGMTEYIYKGPTRSTQTQKPMQKNEERVR